MRFIVAMGQRLRGYARRVGGSVLAVGILLAVPALGLTHLGSDLLASWAEKDAEQASLAGDPLGGLLAFDAPAATAIQHQAQANNRGALPMQLALLLEDWRFTQQQMNPLTMINQFEQNLTLGEFYSDMTALSLGLPVEAVNYMLFQQLFLNEIFTQELLLIVQNTHPKPPTPASPWH